MTSGSGASWLTLKNKEAILPGGAYCQNNSMTQGQELTKQCAPNKVGSVSLRLVLGLRKKSQVEMRYPKIGATISTKSQVAAQKRNVSIATFVSNAAYLVTLLPLALLGLFETIQCLPQPPPQVKCKREIKNKLPTPIDCERLADRLKVCDPIDSTILLQGFKNGFDIGFRSIPNCSPNIANLKSAEENPITMNAAIQKEIDLGRIKGPFDHPPFPSFQISPIGLVPKKEPNTFRMITHLSCPEGQSINDGIDDLFATVVYSSVQDAIKLIVNAGREVFLAKADIKSAFRLIPIAPDQYHLLCFKWQNKYYYDKCFPMGVRKRV